MNHDELNDRLWFRPRGSSFRGGPLQIHVFFDSNCVGVVHFNWNDEYVYESIRFTHYKDAIDYIRNQYSKEG